MHHIQDNSDVELEQEFYDVDECIIKRQSQDKCNVCTRGSKLLELCKSARLRIINGRILGDSMGSLTCHTYNGSSVVDYFITDDESVCSIEYFQVMEFNGLLSDHCAISFSCVCNFELTKINQNDGVVFNKKFKWSKDSIVLYQDVFTHTKVCDKIKILEEIYQDSKYNIDHLVEKITDVYTTAADMSLKLITSRNKVKHKRNKKWFDNNLLSLRNDVYRYATLFKNNPYIPEVRKAYYNTLKLYNKERKRKRRIYRQNMINKLDSLRSSDPKAFWSLLKVLKEENVDEDNCISIDAWKDYFQRLTDSNEVKARKSIIQKLTALENEPSFNELNFMISEKETSKALNKLKNNKSVGLDLISNEMLKYSQYKMIPWLVKLFNRILVCNNYPVEWCKGYIVPIFKKGKRDIESNYRGITLFSCLGKLFNSIINNRIEEYVDKNNIIDSRQIGFKKKSRVSDHMFIIKTLIDKYVKGDSKLFTCFVDFSKAFDSVNHTYLMYKLQKYGIKGNIYETLKNMYTIRGLKSCVKRNNMLSGFFDTQIGVRQGDPLSPLLFKIFINDLNDYLEEGKDRIKIGDLNVNHLMYADDLVLIAKDEDELQNLLSQLNKFCNDWGLKVNIDKTKVVIFNKKGKLCETKITYDSIQIESVLSYKYLGIKFTANGKFDIAKQDLLERGLKAMFKLTSTFNELKPDFDTSIHLFDRLVTCVLSYGSELYGYKVANYNNIYNELKNDVYEKCHTKFLRYVLGVNKRAPIIGLYGDTGRYPLKINCIFSFLRYYHRINNSKNELLKQAYECNIDHSSNWFKSIKKLCTMLKVSTEQMGNLSDYKIGKNVLNYFKREFREGWKNELFSNVRKGEGGNKLRTYRLFKTQFY